MFWATCVLGLLFGEKVYEMFILLILLLVEIFLHVVLSKFCCSALLSPFMIIYDSVFLLNLVTYRVSA